MSDDPHYDKLIEEELARTPEITDAIRKSIAGLEGCYHEWDRAWNCHLMQKWYGDPKLHKKGGAWPYKHPIRDGAQPDNYFICKRCHAVGKSVSNQFGEHIVRTR